MARGARSEWSSVAISGHPLSSVLLRCHPLPSDVNQQAITYLRRSSRPAVQKPPRSGRRRACDGTRSSVVISGHQWSSVVISGHQWSSSGRRRASACAAAAAYGDAAPPSPPPAVKTLERARAPKAFQTADARRPKRRRGERPKRRRGESQIW